MKVSDDQLQKFFDTVKLDFVIEVDGVEPMFFTATTNDAARIAERFMNLETALNCRPDVCCEVRPVSPDRFIGWDLESAHQTLDDTDYAEAFNAGDFDLSAAPRR